jgi:hypothetical protein
MTKPIQERDARPVRDTEFAEPQFAPLVAVLAQSGEIVETSVCVRLDVEDMDCFAVVTHQYESWGIRFKNAVAICPSNPAYPARSGTKVLMGAPENGWLEATFSRPVQHVSSFVTSSRSTVMRAFNRQNQLVAETTSPANLPSSHRAGESGQPASPNLRLSLDAQNIHKVTFESYSGHLTVDDLCFCA